MSVRNSKAAADRFISHLEVNCLPSRLVWAPVQVVKRSTGATDPEPDHESGPPCLLYVEDDESMFVLLKLAFDELGVPFDIAHACNGEEALQYLHRKHRFADAVRPRAILLDFRLPKKDGLEVLAEISACDALRDIPVVIFTSFPRSDERKKAFELGAVGYLVKPSSIEGFIATVEMIQSLISKAEVG